MTEIKRFFRAFYGKLASSPKRDMLWFMAVVGILWAVQCSLSQTMLPTDTKEAISWGAQFEWGYYKHPPLAAFLAYCFSWLGGFRDGMLYLAAQLSICCGVWFIFLLGRDFFGERRGAMAALALYFLFYYNPSPMNFNPNFVEMALLPALTFVFFRTLRAPSLWKWALVGVLAALSMLGKYSAGIVLAALFVSMMLKKETRAQVFSAGPYLALAVFVLILAPHLFWLAKHDFTPLAYVGESVERSEHGFAFVFDVLGMALYPFAMAAAAFFGASLPRRRWGREVRCDRTALLWGVIPCALPALIFFVIGLKGGNVIGTWFFSLTAWAPIAVMAAWPWRISGKCLRRFFLILCAFTAVMFVAITIDANVKSRYYLHTDPAVLRKKVEKYWHRFSSGNIPCVVGEGEIAYAVEIYFPDRPPAAEMEDALSMELVRPVIQKQGGLFIAKGRKEVNDFIRTECRNDVPIPTDVLRVPYRAKWSTTEVRDYFVAYLPPGCLLRKEERR
ncbi:MAG: glycosyltransferase family 39 protein [Victivallaceae bacterium]|nr:glycosyltransferase family 39 protein [Victivallaceae bacterium]